MLKKGYRAKDRQAREGIDTVNRKQETQQSVLLRNENLQTHTSNFRRIYCVSEICHQILLLYDCPRLSRHASNPAWLAKAKLRSLRAFIAQAVERPCRCSHELFCMPLAQYLF